MLSADFSKETLQARRGWKEVLKIMKGKDLQDYSIQQSSRNDGQYMGQWLGEPPEHVADYL